MITTAPLRFTNATQAWLRLLQALGARPVVESPEWTLVRAGAGVLALHGADATEAGRTELWFSVDDPAELGEAMRARGADVVTEHLEGVGPVRHLTTAQGLRLGLQAHDTVAGVPSGEPDPRLAVLPLWIAPDVTAAAEDLVALGARRRLASESGAWADLATDDGLVGVHEGAPGVVLSFEYDGDVDDLARRVEAAGLAARVIDESYGRTLRVDDPDGGPELWVNQRQTDLYGYRQG